MEGGWEWSLRPKVARRETWPPLEKLAIFANQPTSLVSRPEVQPVIGICLNRITMWINGETVAR